MARVSKLQKEIMACLSDGTEDGLWVPVWVLQGDLDAYPCSLHRALTKLLERGIVVRRKSFDDSIDKRWYYDYCLTELAEAADKFEQDRAEERAKVSSEDRINVFIDTFKQGMRAELEAKHGHLINR